MDKSEKKQKSLVEMMALPSWRETIESFASTEEMSLKKGEEYPPSWVRFVAGALGFFSSLLALGVPAIALLIVDRLIPSGNSASLLTLLGLGLGTAISVCLIDLMRMRALESYFTNVRSLVLYQDSCFALFWMLTLAFISPFLPLISIFVAVCLFVVWKVRKNRSFDVVDDSTGSRLDPSLMDSVGLGPAYLQQASQGKVRMEGQPDFQTVGQTSWLNFLQLSTAVLSICVAAWLHIGGAISMGTMFAALFLTQYITNVFVKFYQVQVLKPVQPDLSFIESFDFPEKTKAPSAAGDGIEMLSIIELEDFGFAPFSAELFQGLCLTLIGPSGSGKSKILRSIAIGQFFEGKIVYRGTNWGRNHGRLKYASYAPSKPVTLLGSVVENVTCFDPTARPLPAIELLRKLDPFEDVFGDKDFLNEAVDTANAAQSQIVSLARAFWLQSEIIILDKPETYIDKASKSALVALILKAKTEGKIVILSTDDEYLMSVADEVVKLERGEVADRGPMGEVLERFHQRWVRVSFLPTKREAFRLSLWLEAQFPRGMSEELKSRVKQAAQDMLFFAPRDQSMGDNEEILFDVRMNPNEVFITMHDRGDVLSNEQLSSDERAEYDRVISQSDGFDQTLREGYRQLAVRFSKDRDEVNDRLIAER